MKNAGKNIYSGSRAGERGSGNGSTEIAATTESSAAGGKIKEQAPSKRRKPIEQNQEKGLSRR